MAFDVSEFGIIGRVFGFDLEIAQLPLKVTSVIPV